MDKHAAALGASAKPAEADGTCLAIDPENLSPEERIYLLEQQMLHMQRVIIKLRKEQQGSPKPALPAADLNKDGLPIMTNNLAIIDGLYLS